MSQMLDAASAIIYSPSLLGKAINALFKKQAASS